MPIKRRNLEHMKRPLLQHLLIRLRVSRWLAPGVCAVPYAGSLLWLLLKGQTWIAAVMLSPLLVLALLLGLTWLLAQLEFKGRWNG